MMKRKGFILLFMLFSVLSLPTVVAKAQQTITVDEVTMVEISSVECKDYYYSSCTSNWFIQLGAGISMPIVENMLPDGDASVKTRFALGVGVGKWFNPYVGLRLSGLGGTMHWDNESLSSAKYINGNAEIMWNMMNSCLGVKTDRLFSIYPYIGLGAAYVWDISSQGTNIYDGESLKRTTWAMPVSVGMQFSFRLNKYLNLFAEARLQAYGDNFNGAAYGCPIDFNFVALGGLSVNVGSKGFKTYNPCTALNYIKKLNSEVNNLREELYACAEALLITESQLPCPEIPAQKVVNRVVNRPLLASVRFNINSSQITDEEMVNVYNVAEYLKHNSEVELVINGYADKDTGSNNFNSKLSEQRAQSVCDALVKCGVKAKQLTVVGHGSNEQPYDNNNWNRIVLFTHKDANCDKSCDMKDKAGKKDKGGKKDMKCDDDKKGGKKGGKTDNKKGGKNRK